jgi:hypothetical protein
VPAGTYLVIGNTTATRDDPNTDPWVQCQADGSGAALVGIGSIPEPGANIAGTDIVTFVDGSFPVNFDCFNASAGGQGDFTVQYSYMTLTRIGP